MAGDTFVVLDFETTGLSPYHGDRAIEIGAVLLKDHKVKDSFQSLMNPGFRVSSFIESYTGISNSMLASAPPCEYVMHRFADFIRDYPLVAHNASFDKKFLDAEFSFINRASCNPVACSMLAARRIYPQAYNHKLGTLVSHCGIVSDGIFHRALNDARMTAGLWLAMISHIKENFALREVSFELMQKLSRVPKAQASLFLKRAAVSIMRGEDI